MTKRKRVLPSIKPKKTPRQYAEQTKAGKIFHTIHGGKIYEVERLKLHWLVDERTKDHKKRATVMAFVHNFFAKHRELPSMAELEKVFPFLGKQKRF